MHKSQNNLSLATERPVLFIPARILLCLALLVGAVTESGAQRVGFGVKAGSNASFFRGQMQLSGMRKFKPGLTVGGYLNFKHVKYKKWQFEIDFMYTSRGNSAVFFNTIDESTLNDLYETRFRYGLGYLEFPILARYMLNRGGVTRPYFLFGPTYSGIMRAKLRDNTGTPGKTVDVRQDVKRDDFGLTLGWGITGFFIDRWYHLDVRYYHGFMNLSDNLTNDLAPYRYGPTYPGQIIQPFRNSTLSITVGVSLERPNQYFLK